MGIGEKLAKGGSFKTSVDTSVWICWKMGFAVVQGNGDIGKKVKQVEIICQSLIRRVVSLSETHSQAH